MFTYSSTIHVNSCIHWQQLAKLADGAEDTKDAKTRKKAPKRKWPRGVATV